MVQVTFPGRPLVSYPLVSFVYKLVYTGTIIARAPLWCLTYALFRQSRPLSKWTFKQAFMVRLFREFVYLISRTETLQPLTLKPGKEKERFEQIEPFSSDMYRGPLESKSVTPAVIGGTWYPHKPVDAGSAGSVMLHIHGGAFVVGDGRTDASGPMAKRLLEQGKVGAIFCPQYRLSSRPTSAPFPAALQDSLTSYLHLVRTLGIPPASITISGDSAGGNLVIALLRYLVEYGPQLDIPQPGSAAVVAPWVAPIKSLWPEITITSNPNFNSDYLGVELCRWGARYYASEVSPSDPYITPLGHPFATPVPIFVSIGAAEIFEIDATQWTREMDRVEGNEIETYYEEGAPHDTLLVGEKLGWDESAEEVARRIGVFIRQHA
ncbi:alpha/beta hydrolase fold-3 domain-containing protein [Xylariaceae sp. FL1651]|nr:alpha/beta hydrolase fold-3 domain-containing protein [Xylariaceae sp. FL1651]